MNTLTNRPSLAQLHLGLQEDRADLHSRWFGREPLLASLTREHPSAIQRDLDLLERRAESLRSDHSDHPPAIQRDLDLLDRRAKSICRFFELNPTAERFLGLGLRELP